MSGRYLEGVLERDRPALVLAPMEGITDAPMRALQGEWGAFSYAVSEFLRVSAEPIPRKVFLRDIPELRNGARTPTGMPVAVQILGGEPEPMAISAATAAALGAPAIDINFGCPAPTVNRHDGGASLLRYPLRIREIVRAVREAVPAEIPVSAKLRLGWDSGDAIDENAAMAAEGGASWLTIHARTKAQGYLPPVDWKAIGRVRAALDLPIIANGDIWTLEDFRRCQDETGCRHFMLGRTALANPALSHQVAADLGIPAPTSPVSDWAAQLRRLAHWTEYYGETASGYTVMKFKQWLKIAMKRGEFRHFDAVKEARKPDEFFARLEVALAPL